ncbi:MAG: GNAT family N-acetyltransferase [Christensenellales bacterium]|jgi:RimJ/RimL family protein N-acetyltransferase
MLVTYENLKIREALPEDAALLCRWWNDGDVMAHAGFPNGLGTDEEAVVRQLAQEPSVRHIIEIDGAAAGEMSCRNKGEGTAEIGIKICDFGRQEKGHGTLLLKMMITRLFSQGYEKIVLDTNVDNLRAQHVYEKIGFTRLRTRRDSWIDQLGRPQSFIDYELLKEKFTPLDIFSD